MSDETKRQAEAWAKDCVHARGAPHTHDLRDAYLAGHDAGVREGHHQAIQSCCATVEGAKVQLIGKSEWCAQLIAGALSELPPAFRAMNPPAQTSDEENGK